jgi:hypothetical protein
MTDYILIIGKLDTRQGIDGTDVVSLRVELWRRGYRDHERVVVEDTHDIHMAILRQQPFEASLVEQDEHRLTRGATVTLSSTDICGLVATTEAFNNKYGVIDALKQMGHYTRLKGKRTRVNLAKHGSRRLKDV